MKTLKFQQNYNNKLHNSFFTTIRLDVNNKLKVGDIYEIYDQSTNRIAGHASIKEIKPIKLHQINEWMARLDSGMSADQLKQFLLNIYKGKAMNLENQEFKFLLMQRESYQSVQKSLF